MFNLFIYFASKQMNDTEINQLVIMKIPPEDDCWIPGILFTYCFNSEANNRQGSVCMDYVVATDKFWLLDHCVDWSWSRNKYEN